MGSGYASINLTGNPYDGQPVPITLPLTNPAIGVSDYASKTVANGNYASKLYTDEGAVFSVATLPTLAASYTAVRGTQRMVAGYSGPLFQLRRESDNALQDFYALASGLPDIAAIQTWVGASYAYPKIAYDQTGNGFNLIYPSLNQNSVGSVARINFARLAPSGSIWFTYSDANGGAVSSAGHSIDMQNHSRFAVVQYHGGTAGTIGSLKDATNVLASWNVGKAWVRDRSTLGGYVSFGAAGLQPCRANPIVIGQTCSATERRLFLAETSRTAAAASFGTATQMVYGNDGLANSYGRWCGDVLTSAALSAGDGATLQSALVTMFSIVTTFDRRLVIGGDSIDAGAVAGLVGLYDFATPTWLRAYPFAGSCEVISLAVAGEQMGSSVHASSDAVFTANVAPFFTHPYGAGKLVYYEGHGTNDLGPGGITDTALKVFSQRVIRMSKAAGAKALIAQILPRKNTAGAPWDATKEGYRVAYNDYLALNSDTYVADLIFRRGDTASTMGALAAPDDTTLYFTDKLHPINLGQTYLATGQPLAPTGPASLQAAVNALWA